MSAEVAAHSASPWQDARTTVAVAVRSALGAIALVSLFDRQFVLSKWLHWTLVHWADFLNFVFSLSPIHVPDPNKPLAAFLIVILSTVAFDVFVRARATFGEMRNSDAPPWAGPFGQIGLWAGAFYVAISFGMSTISRPNLPFWAGSAALLFALLASPRMFLWLAAFTTALIGLNEVALLFERSVPLPP